MSKKKMALIFIGVPAFILALSFAVYRIVMAEPIITQKSYAAAVQAVYTSRYLNEAPTRDIVALMARKGKLDKELVAMNDTAKGVHFIDPFALGGKRMTWSYKNKIAPYGKDYKLRGDQLTFVTNNSDLVVLVYAGPDGRITNTDFDVSVFKSGAQFNLLQDSLDNEKMIVPQYGFAEPVAYDPTNGLRSEGDIFWPIFKNEAYGWHAVYPRVE